MKLVVFLNLPKPSNYITNKRVTPCLVISHTLFHAENTFFFDESSNFTCFTSMTENLQRLGENYTLQLIGFGPITHFQVKTANFGEVLSINLHNFGDQGHRKHKVLKMADLTETYLHVEDRKIPQVVKNSRLTDLRPNILKYSILQLLTFHKNNVMSHIGD